MRARIGWLIVTLALVGCGSGSEGRGDGAAPGGDARPEGADGAGRDSGGEARDSAGELPDTGAGDRLEGDRFDGMAGSADAAAEHAPADAATVDASSAMACPGDRMPNEAFCNPATARACGLSTGATCRCQPVCSGAAPLPGMDYVWSCPPPAPAGCPANTPTGGTACTSDGLECMYGTCGGSSARCQAGRWSVTLIPPPP